MIKKFINSIKKNQPILLSYSGGLDSSVLLYKLLKFTKQYPFIKLRAIHINHQINPKSEMWNQHCIKICKKNNIILISKIIFIKNKSNIQKIARELRYEMIKKYIFSNEILVTGHHLNDQCETFFLSLKRGSGLTGLSGISYSNTFKNHQKIIRPLLSYSKINLTTWAKNNKIQWIEDNSNLNNKYDRNFIRNKIIYQLQKKWPYFIKNCFRSMKILKYQEITLNNFLDTIIYENSIFKNSLNIIFLKNFKKEKKILIIKRWIQLCKKIIISYKKIKEIYNNIIKINIKNENYKVTIKNFEIRKYQNTIFIVSIHPSVKNNIIFWNDCTKILTLPQNIGNIIQDKNGTKIIQPKINDIISIRFQTNKKIFTNQDHHTSLKNIWQQNNIPPWMRNRIPLLYYNNKLIYIVGLLQIPNNNSINNKKKYWKIAWINNIIKNDF